MHSLRCRSKRVAILLGIALHTVGGQQPVDPALLFSRLSLPDAAAVCNDGTRAALYHRPCTANADRKPGDDTDYCAGEQTLILHFLGGELPPPAAVDVVPAAADASPTSTAALPGAFCYSAASCATRARALRSSSALPLTTFPPGLTSPAPEVNPNLYKAHAALVPSCTSDLFAGNTSAFAGRVVVDAAFAALGNPAALLPGGLQVADRLILIGPAGVLARLNRALRTDERVWRAISRAGPTAPGRAIFTAPRSCRTPCSIFA